MIATIVLSGCQNVLIETRSERSPIQVVILVLSF